MPSGKFCPVCKHKNRAEATHCAFCQTPLEGTSPDAATTTHVVGAQPELLIKPAQHLPLLAQLPFNALVLFVMDNAEPIVVKECVKVVLGRQISQTSIPVVDLVPYEAGKYGVSRQHAIIMNMQDSFTIQDLDSTNGTWVDGQRLESGKQYPLASGSQLRLGQLTLYAYFRLRVLAEDILLLYEEARGSALLRPALTPHYLADVVHPYLQALADVQHVLDQARGQHHSQIFINTISAARQASPIGVSLSGVGDAVRVAKAWILPWRKANTGLLSGPSPASIQGGAVAGPGGESHASATGPAREPSGKTGALPSNATRLIPDADLSRTESGSFHPDLKAAVHKLAIKILEQFLPDVSEPDHETYATALAPPLINLATSRLQMHVE